MSGLGRLVHTEQQPHKRDQVVFDVRLQAVHTLLLLVVVVVVVVVVVEMSIIWVALWHCGCRTTVQCQQNQFVAASTW